MKIKVLASILCAGLVLFIFTGCGMKLPKTSSDLPGPSASPSVGDLSNATTVIGIANDIDGETITLGLVAPSDGQTSADDQTVTLGASVYVVTGGTQQVAAGSAAVILENDGYAGGMLSDIAAGDFLAVILNDDTAVAIIDAGQTGGSGAGTDTGTDGELPPVEPTDDGAAASQGVPDSDEQITYMITTDSLKIRSGPGTEYSVLGILDTGSMETGTVKDGWLAFTYDGKAAYCSAQYLEPSTAPEGVPDSSESKTYTTTDNLTARNGPGTTYKVLGTLSKGTSVVGTVSGGWLKFTYNDNTAYCSAAYLALD